MVAEVERSRLGRQQAGDVEPLEARDELAQKPPQTISSLASRLHVGYAVEQHATRLQPADLVTEDGQKLGGSDAARREVHDLDESLLDPFPERQSESVRRG